MKHWILDENGEPVETDLLTWARWFENPARILANDQIGDIRVSTVFLGVDHNFSDKGPPHLWETMVFGAPEKTTLFGRTRMISPDLGEMFDQLQQRRYSSRAKALAGHAETWAAAYRLHGLMSTLASRTPAPASPRSTDDTKARK